MLVANPTGGSMMVGDPYCNADGIVLRTKTGSATSASSSWTAPSAS